MDRHGLDCGVLERNELTQADDSVFTDEVVGASGEACDASNASQD